MKSVGFIMLMIGFLLFSGLMTITFGEEEIEITDTAIIAIIMLWGFGGINYGIGMIIEKIEKNEPQE